MNIDEIRELAQLLKQNELSALEISEGESRVRLERGGGGTSLAGTVPAAADANASNPVEDDPGVDFSNLTEVKSPMVGVFYAAPAPESDPFVRVGQRVKRGDVLCIVEAMKLMNEIVAERDGEIFDICVSNGDVVEFGQCLFRLN